MIYLMTSECDIIALGAPAPYTDLESHVQKIDKFFGLPIFQVDTLIVTGDGNVRISDQVRIRSTAVDPDIAAGEKLKAIGLGIRSYSISGRPGWSFHAERIELGNTKSTK